MDKADHNSSAAERSAMDAWVLPRIRLRVMGLLLTALILGAASRPGEAATYTWTGASNASNWSDTNRGTSNWSGNAVPTASSTNAYIFAGSTQTTNVNDISNLSATSLTFASGAGAFSISGSSITLRGTVSNSSTNLQTINLNLILGTSGTFDASSGDILVGGTISGASTLTKTGTNDLTFTAANTDLPP